VGDSEIEGLDDGDLLLAHSLDEVKAFVLRHLPNRAAERPESADAPAPPADASVSS
jgi:hypothetical protein